MAQQVYLMGCGDGITRADNGCFGKGPFAKTAAYTVKPLDTGSMFSNKGATASVTITLPAAKAGMWFTFLKVAAQDLLIKASGGAKIAGSTANKVYKNVTAGDAGTATLTIVSDGTDWYVRGLVGTWAIDNT
jgi:hypothetical protein